MKSYTNIQYNISKMQKLFHDFPNRIFKKNSHPFLPFEILNRVHTLLLTPAIKT
jgi:hypothetical protein